MKRERHILAPGPARPARDFAPLPPSFRFFFVLSPLSQVGEVAELLHVLMPSVTPSQQRYFLSMLDTRGQVEALALALARSFSRA